MGTLHIVQGDTTGDKRWLDRASRLGLTRKTWVAPKKAVPGDDVVIYITGYGFYATARVLSSAHVREDWPGRYGVSIGQVRLLQPPVPLKAIRSAIRSLTWAIYPRSINTPKLVVADRIRRLLPKPRKAILGAGMSSQDSFELVWNEAPIKNYRDILPVSWFARIRNPGVRDHLVLGPRQGQFIAKCAISVQRKRAVLDYSRFSEFNTINGMKLGCLRLHFDDAARRWVRSAEWKTPGGVWKKCDLKCRRFESAPTPSYVRSNSRSARVEKRVRVRAGQRAFCDALYREYGGRCLVSGCDVSSVLEGAHIDPFTGPKSHHVQNGLLLRKDLHALFDANLLGIEPKSLTVYLAAEARQWPEYAGWDGKRQLLGDRLSLSTRPALEPLQRRWRKFTKQHGNPGRTRK